MLAVKAKYENGTVRWEQKPPVEGLHDMIVVFADVSASNIGRNQELKGHGFEDLHGGARS